MVKHVYIFNGLNPKRILDKFITMNRVSNDKNKIILNVSNNELIKTVYGYAFIIDRTHVVFLKDWQVNINCFKNEILLLRDDFKIKKWGIHKEFSNEDKEDLTFDDYLEIALFQDNFFDMEIQTKNKVLWQIEERMIT